MRAYRFSTSSAPASLNVTRCTVKPAAFSVFSRNLSAPPSAGLTDRQRSKSRAIATGSADTAMAPLVPEEFVDAGLGTGAFVDAFDDNSAIETRSAAFPRQCTGHNHRIGGHFALLDLACLPVNDTGRCNEINAHRQHLA